MTETKKPMTALSLAVGGLLGAVFMMLLFTFVGVVFAFVWNLILVSSPITAFEGVIAATLATIALRTGSFRFKV